MKIKCIKIYNEHTKEYQEKGSWLTIGKEYIVLAIEIYCNRVEYLIVDDSNDKTPGLHQAEQFELISGVIPKNWEIMVGSIELFVIGPKAWRAIDFWNDYYEGKTSTLEIYEREAKIIYEEEDVK